METPRNGEEFRDETVELTSFIPLPGGFHLMFVTIPPQIIGTTVASAEEVFRDAKELQPGLADLFDESGFHETKTVDLIIVLEGSVELLVGDSAPVVVNHGEVVIQRGARHAWRNTGTASATIAAVLIGALDTSEQ